ncbi:MAG: CHAD domain-containing protein [Anaerolineae bacterium]
MDMSPAQEFIDHLKTHVQSVLPEDTMAEAGRKALLPDFIDMLSHADGSRTGEDLEEVHDMRVATRRMRSALRLLSDYYKPKSIQTFNRSLRKVAGALGSVRDLDVLIENLQKYQAKLGDEQKALFQPVIDRLDGDRQHARRVLVRVLDKGDFRRFVNDYAEFLTTQGAGARSQDGTPAQVRYLLPTLIYEHLGTVRAYDAQIAEGDAATLHALRIEFKRLRYIVSLFASVLGSSSKNFINELKAIQDHLGNLNDSRVAQDRLSDLLPDLSEAEAEVLNGYIDTLRQEEEKLREQVGEVWRHFNSKTVQRQLANAVTAL